MLRRRTLLCGLSLLLITPLLLAAAGDSARVAAPAAPAAPPPSDYTLSGPFAHENLTIFLIHGPDRIKGKAYVTLQEAMEKKLVVVHETGNVNELVIENVSDLDVYIQSGDIVKGGKQDRTLQHDLIASAKAKTPVPAFCVESGRWQQRGGEDAAKFASSGSNLATKAQKVAAKAAGDQSAVWEEVSVAQRKLSENAGGAVNDARSATSLQLALENQKVTEAVEAYRKALAAAPAGKADVVGLAFAINGKLNSVDVYASNALFGAMWEKNLRAAAAEAFAEMKKDAKFEPLAADAVKRCLDDAAKGQATAQDLNPRMQVVTRQTKDNLQYETYDRKAAAPAHINILTRDAETERVLQRQQERGQQPLQQRGRPQQQRQEQQQELQQAPNAPAVNEAPRQQQREQ